MKYFMIKKYSYIECRLQSERTDNNKIISSLLKILTINCSLCWTGPYKIVPNIFSLSFVNQKDYQQLDFGLTVERWFSDFPLSYEDTLCFSRMCTETSHAGW